MEFSSKNRKGSATSDQISLCELISVSDSMCVYHTDKLMDWWSVSQPTLTTPHSLSLSLALKREWWVMLAALQAAIYMSALLKRNRSEPVHTDSQGLSRSPFTLSVSLCVIDSDVGAHELPSSSLVTFCLLEGSMVQIPGKCKRIPADRGVVEARCLFMSQTFLRLHDSVTSMSGKEEKVQTIIFAILVSPTIRCWYATELEYTFTECAACAEHHVRFVNGSLFWIGSFQWFGLIDWRK